MYPDSREDTVWDAVVEMFLALVPVEPKVSGYAAKRTLTLHSRDVAHQQAPGVIEIRITAAGWSALTGAERGDPRVRRDPARPDWVELHISTVSDAAACRDIIAIAATANE